MAIYNVTYNLTTSDFMNTVNTISGGLMFSVISGIMFSVIFIYVFMSTRDMGRSLAISSFIGITISVFFVAIGVMTTALMVLYTIGVIVGILLMNAGGGVGY